MSHADRWTVVRPLGEGGQGRTFLVTDSTGEFSGEYVLKRLKNVARLDRFKLEIEALKKLDDPAVQRVVWVSDDEAAYVSPYYGGGTLQARVEHGDFRGAPLPALRLFERLCWAVAHCHAKGLVHRDLKPSNIAFDVDGNPVLIDFGLCFSDGDEKRLTETMEQVGSRWYMAPEFEGGRAGRITPKADCYSLGKVLFFVLTGSPLPRERYTEREYDLVRLTGDFQLGYVQSKILSSTLLVAPDDRASAEKLALLAGHIASLIKEHYYPGKVGSKCRFCGEGTYRARERLGIETRTRSRRGEDRFEAICCDSCGHFVMFLSAEPDVR